MSKTKRRSNDRAASPTVIWSAKRCVPCEGGVPPLSEAKVRKALRTMSGWELVKGEIVKTYSFIDYYRTMAFVNAIAWIAHQENHHPDLEVGYNKCRVRYSTHSIGGISENDLICAAKVEGIGLG